MPTLRDVHIEAPMSASPLSKEAIEPGASYALMKPGFGAYTLDELSEWAAERYPLYASTKIDGYRASIHFDGAALKIHLDSAKPLALPITIAETRPFVIEGEFTATVQGKSLARTELASVISGRQRATPHFYLYDLLYLANPKAEGGDVHQLSFAERLALLKTLRLPPSTFSILKQVPVSSSQDLAAATQELARQPLSEGIYVRQNAPYVFGSTDTAGKLKATLELKVAVLAIARKANGVIYQCGLREPDPYINVIETDGVPYVDLGHTFVTTNQNVVVGDTLNVRVEELIVLDGPRLSWGKPTALNPSRDPAHSAAQALSLARRAGAAKEEAVKDDAVPIYKTDDEQHLVYGVVLAPGTPDSQGDIMTAEDIQAAAHKWLIKSRAYDYQHAATLPSDKVVPVESYLLPADLQIDEAKTLRAGTWILVSKILDDALWAEIKAGKINAYSIRGYGKRRPLSEADLAKLQERTHGL